MATHHDGEPLADRQRKLVTELAAADKSDALVFGDAVGEHRTLVVDDPMRQANLRKAYARRRMRMHDAGDIGPSRVAPRMDPQLAVRRAFARHDLAFGVED